MNLKKGTLISQNWQKIDWTQASIIQFEPSPSYGKYKETAHILYSNKPISHVWRHLFASH
jgi:hypothetical protein